MRARSGGAPFLQGSLFFVTRWQDEFPHEVTITKPFYMAEHPITQKCTRLSWGRIPGTRLAKGPVENVPYDGMVNSAKQYRKRTQGEFAFQPTRNGNTQARRWHFDPLLDGPL